MSRVKICGVRDVETARVVAEGADLMGFIMSRGFWRYVEPERVRSICCQAAGCQRVGVFVDEPASRVAELAAYCRLDYVQLHGHEGPEYAKELAALLRTQGDRTRLIKAFRYGEDFSVEAADSYPADLVLIDSYSKNAVGGSGTSFAWQQAAPLIRQVRRPYLIAGGISSDNVQEAMELFQPYGVDVSSALEVGRQKQPELIREFLQKAGRI